MTVVVRIRGTGTEKEKEKEIEDVVNFKMDTAHFWLKLKGDKYQTFWRRNVELVRIKDSEVKEELEKSEEKVCSTCRHLNKDVDTEEPCKSCHLQSYWEKRK